MKQTILLLLPPEYPWAENLLCFPSVGSTNDVLKTMARQGAPEGTAVIAACQTDGHGRRGRSFQSSENLGVYLSFLLRPGCPADALMHLTCAAGTAMCDAVEKTAGIRPGIKWTNDLVHETKKLGGILTELGFAPDGTVDWAIVGIGINCLHRREDFAPELQDMAASLSMVTGHPIRPAVLAASMLEALHTMSYQLLRDREHLMARYRRDCITLGRRISVVHGDTSRHGTALDIDGNGALIVQFPEGIETVSSGEVSIRGMYGYI